MFGKLLFRQRRLLTRNRIVRSLSSYGGWFHSPRDGYCSLSTPRSNAGVASRAEVEILRHTDYQDTTIAQLLGFLG
jgi:hypothetical protein